MALSMYGATRYRHASGQELKRELCYPDLTPSVQTDAQSIAASSKYIGVADMTSNGGNVVVLDHENVGKRKTKLSFIQAHGKQIFDMQFSPFNPSVIATASDDALARVFQIPDGGLFSDISTPLASLAGHKRAVQVLRWHPTAENVVATGGSDSIAKIWDVEHSADKLTLEGAKGAVQGLSWSYDGSVLVTTSADKSIRLHDVRSGAVTSEVVGHEGVKASRVVFAAPGDRFVSTGFARTRDREVCSWDMRNLSAPLFRNNLDSSTGILTPFYDPDSQMLFVSGKGDSTIRVFELKNDRPFFTAHSVVSGPDPVRAACALPKHALDVMKCEVFRMFKLTNNTVIPVSFKIPRKSYLDFADDLFPLSLADTPTLSATQFFEGADYAPTPKLISLNPASRGGNPSSSSSSPSSSISSPASSPSPAQSISSPASSSSYSPASSSRGPSSPASSSSSPAPQSGPAPYNPWHKPVVEEVKAVYVPKVPVNIVRKTHYRHIDAKLGMRKDHFDNINAEYGVESPLQASTEFLAFPRAGPGGRIAVVPLSKPGKLVDDFGCLEVGAPVLCFEFSPFHPDVLATGDEAGHLKLWKIPADLLARKGNNLTTPVMDLQGHTTRITTINWNPVAANIIATTAHDGTIRIWDTESGTQALVCTGLLSDLVVSIKWNYDGSLLAVITRDHILRIIDPRASAVLSEGPSHQGSKGERLAWCGPTGLIVSVGFSKSSHRELNVWKSADIAAGPIANVELDAASGVSQPFYDEGTGVVFLCGRGDGTIFYWEITPDEPPYAHRLGSNVTAEPLADVCFLPKRVVDVRNVEIIRLLKLCPNIKTIQPISMLVPRQRKEFFQDDIYGLAPSHVPALAPAEWLAGATKGPNLVSLNPDGMVPLSQAPAVEQVKKYVFDPKAPVKTVSQKDAVLGEYYDKMNQFKQYEPDANSALHKAEDGVDEEEWSD